MKYYQLFIRFESSLQTYNAISEILKLKPTEDKPSKFSSEIPDLWFYRVEENEEEGKSFDFINKFLEIIEPNYIELSKLGVTKKDILFWLVYEYDQQCALEFHPQEMLRLGESGIHLNIDCHKTKDK
jgi:hypothetical protein